MECLTRYAPVLICTLNRYEHFKRCIESLSACDYAELTDVYICVDFPFDESHFLGYNKILDYLPSISGFKTLNITIRNRNFGVVDNWIDMHHLVFLKHDCIIVSEDDNIFARSFLDFVNQGLEKFKDNKQIFSISGYNFPINLPDDCLTNIYLWPGFAGWGVGLWRDRFYNVNKTFENLDICIRYQKYFFRDIKKVLKLNNIANHLVPSLLESIRKKVFLGDTHYCLYINEEKMFSVFPPVSLVKNLGQDGTGTNSGFDKMNIYLNQIIFAGKFNWELNPVQNNIISKLIYEHFKTSYLSKIKLCFNLLKFYLFKNN
jgi:hypothetical protein